MGGKFPDVYLLTYFFFKNSFSANIPDISLLYNRVEWWNICDVLMKFYFMWTISKLYRLCVFQIVGVHPKDLSYTSDCTRLVVANAGPATIVPSTSKFSDPEGTVTIIFRNDQGFPVEVSMDFTQLNGRYVLVFYPKSIIMSYELR